MSIGFLEWILETDVAIIISPLMAIMIDFEQRIKKMQIHYSCLADVFASQPSDS